MTTEVFNLWSADPRGSVEILQGVRGGQPPKTGDPSHFN